MNALRQNSKTNLRAFFSSIPISTVPPQPSQSPKKPNKKGNPRNPAKKPPPKEKPYKKKKISGALREAVWIKTMGRRFEGKCPVVWCPNTITVFDFQSGHNIPESKGGSTTLPNLIPICARCNFSMGNQYTIDEWNALHAAVPAAASLPQSPPPPKSFFKKYFSCFFQIAK
jgi:5-methylcytosine-specific restriction endonuclease McrA